MTDTTNREYPYPDPDVDPDVPYWMQRLAEALDVDVQTLADRLTATESAEYAEFTAFAVQHVANTNYGPGQFTADPTRYRNNSFAVADAPDMVAITKPGLYLVETLAVGTSAVPNGYVSIRDRPETKTHKEANIGGGPSWNYGTSTVVLVDGVQASTKVAGAINTGYILRVRTFLTANHTSTATLKITRLRPTT